jgi:hypothetical protein
VISVWPLTLLRFIFELIPLEEETMVDAILEFLLSVSLILSGILTYLLFSIRDIRTRHDRHAH